MVRIRKQWGIGWFLLMLGVYLAEVPVFAVGSLFSKKFTNSDVNGYIRNMGTVLTYVPSILQNKPTFYKVL